MLSSTTDVSLCSGNLPCSSAVLPFSGGLWQRHLGAPVHGSTIRGQVNIGWRKGRVRSHRMPPDPRWQESSWRRGGEPARLSGIAATEILVFSAHWSQIKFAETEFGANRKMALTLKPTEGRTQLVPASRSLSALHRESRGSNSWGSQSGVGDMG